MKKGQVDSNIKVNSDKIATKKKDYLEFNLPKLPKLPSFKNTNINYYLVLALVVLGFFLGMLTNKVLYLQESLKTAEAKPAAVLAGNAQANDAAAAAPAPTRTPKEDVTVGHLPTIGNDNAKVTVVEFSDYQCPFCEQFDKNTFPQLNDEYIKTGKIRFAYRHYPLTSIHPNAQKAAEASECANEQGKFWDYHAKLFESQENWTTLTGDALSNAFADYAGGLGLDQGQFKSCLDAEKYKQLVDADAADGATAGVDGTPTFFVNGWRMVGAQPFAQIQQLIEQELKK